MVQAIQVLRFHLLELEKVSVLHFILVMLDMELSAVLKEDRCSRER